MQFKIAWIREVGNVESVITGGNVLFRDVCSRMIFVRKWMRQFLDVKSYLSEERISSMIQAYRTVTQTYLKKMPDQMYAPLTDAEYEDNRIGNSV